MCRRGCAGLVSKSYTIQSRSTYATVLGLLSLILMSSVSAFGTEFVCELASCLEGTVGVAAVLLDLVLVGNVAPLGSQFLCEFRALGEGSVRVAVGVRLWSC